MGWAARTNNNPLKGMPKMRAQIVISLDENGSVNINGPIADKLLCYGLLELAKDLITDWHLENKRKVQPATPEETSKLVMP